MAWKGKEVEQDLLPFAALRRFNLCPLTYCLFGPRPREFLLLDPWPGGAEALDGLCGYSAGWLPMGRARHAEPTQAHFRQHASAGTYAESRPRQGLFRK